MSKFVVIDLEMCSVAKQSKTKRYHYSTETIQIGAVLMDENYEIVDTFKTYVCPQFGSISPKIEKLTGISREDVADAPIFEEALRKFENWFPHDATLVSWSNADRYQIIHETTGKDIQVEREELLTEESWIDCQKIFGEKADRANAYNLTEALNLSDIDYKDGAHDGYVDAYNTALLFAKLKKTPDFEFNSYYLNSDKEKDSFSYSMGDLFANLQI